MQTYDVAVIGGGPAGLMAAGRAAERGARVVLLEKNPTTGQKLLITGGGRCNILNMELDPHRLTEKYGKKGRALFSAFAQFGVPDTVEFFESRGLPLKVEAEQRAFPASEKAADVHRTMLAFAKQSGVDIRTGSPVAGLLHEAGRVTGIRTPAGSVTATNYIVATGGKSHPETGSTGDGFVWLRDLGHTIITPDPALVPITIRNPWIAKLAGISLQGVKLTVWQGNTKHDAKIGKLLFTHTGLSGPLVLNMSKGIGALLKKGNVRLSLDLFPTRDQGALDRLVLMIFERGKNKLLKNHVSELVPSRLGHLLISLAGIDGETPLRQLTRDQRLAFVRILKDLSMDVSGLLGVDKAVVTGGGIALDEVDFKTMRSKRFSNLYLAGDVLDFDRPSGGFSLQICWSTGWVAGTHAASR